MYVHQYYIIILKSSLKNKEFPYDVFLNLFKHVLKKEEIKFCEVNLFSFKKVFFIISRIKHLQIRYVDHNDSGIGDIVGFLISWLLISRKRGNPTRY